MRLDPKESKLSHTNAQSKQGICKSENPRLNYIDRRVHAIVAEADY
ncbi:uncharacterized protein G2W53_006112 [Senna tora]|uniref:Uncharacterized protein n=1 Tax=Senna tora TaxID=362788 RepID=A0A835CEH1_9FABA|nr:uncharacterized protein G2W53_006112 [Senna tora]